MTAPRYCDGRGERSVEYREIENQTSSVQHRSRYNAATGALSSIISPVLLMLQPFPCLRAQGSSFPKQIPLAVLRPLLDPTPPRHACGPRPWCEASVGHHVLWSAGWGPACASTGSQKQTVAETRK